MQTIEPRREAQIIVPTGIEHETALQRLIARLVDRFGGATLDDTPFGYWKAPDGELIGEPVTTITVAVPCDTPQSDLEDFAAHACVWFKQQAIYLRLPGGTVEILPRDWCEELLNTDGTSHD